MKITKTFFLAVLLIACFFGVQPLYSAMTGGDYEIISDVISGQQGGEVTGGDYILESTVGEPAVGESSSGTFELQAGFWSTVGSITYSLSKNSISLDFGADPTAIVVSDSVTLTVSTDSTSGFTAVVTEDGNLRSGGNDIDDVTDGDITAGTEEYGIKNTATSGDVSSSISSSYSAIANNLTVLSGTKPVTGVSGTFTFAAAVATATQSGSYAHTVTFSVVANP